MGKLAEIAEQEDEYSLGENLKTFNSYEGGPEEIQIE